MLVLVAHASRLDPLWRPSIDLYKSQSTAAQLALVAVALSLSSSSSPSAHHRGSANPSCGLGFGEIGIQTCLHDSGGHVDRP